MMAPALPSILWWSSDMCDRRQHDDEFAPGLILEAGSLFFLATDQGWQVMNELPDDARRLVVEPPAADVRQPATEPHRTNADDRVTTAEVYAWHVGRFGEPDVRMVALKLAEEAGEACGAVVKRAEGAYRPAKGLVTREDWTGALFDEMGDVAIVLHVLAGREGVTLDELVRRRFRDDVSLRTDQERAQ